MESILTSEDLWLRAESFANTIARTIILIVYSVSSMKDVRRIMELSIPHLRGRTNNQGKDREKKKKNLIEHFIILFNFV